MQTADPISELRNLTDSELSEVARNYFSETGPIDSVQCEFTEMDVTSIGTGTVALVKAEGTARVASETRQWSSIVKIVEPDAESSLGGDDPTSSVWSEVNTYRDNLFAAVAPGFRGARCHKVDDRGNGQVWVWMEDLSDYSGSNWSQAEYMLAASGIGRFKAHWLNTSTEQYQWIPAHSRATELDKDVLLIRNQENFISLKNSDFFRSGVVGDNYGRLLGLRELIPLFMDATKAVPNTISHNDCHIRNLFAAPDLSAVVAIDFARVAIAPIGMDAGDLLGSSFMWTDPEADAAIESSDKIYDAWASGIRSSNVTIPDHVTRFGFLFPLLRRAIAVPGMLAWAALDHDFPLRRYEGSRDQMPESIARRFDFLLPLIEEGTALAQQITA